MLTLTNQLANQLAIQPEGSTMLDEPIPKRNDIWRCPQCDNEIILHVRVSEPPVCRNKNAHSTKSQIMVKFNPNRKQAQ